MFWLNALLVASTVIFIALVAFVYLAPGMATNLALNAERRRSGLTRRYIELPDGLRYAYLEGGQGEALMLLHGFGGNKDNFTRVARVLVRHCRVIVPDMVGFGESSRPTDADYAPAAQAESLRAFAHALGIHMLHLGGNSMGAQIAMNFASQYPTEVKSLWLLSPGAIWSAPGELFAEFKATGNNRLIARNLEQFQQVMALGMAKVPWIPKPMLKVLAQERIQNAALEDRILHQFVDGSEERQIAGIRTPTLIVFGDKDRIFPASTADVFKKLLPHASVIVLRGIGHVPMFESPAQCAKDYLAFRAAHDFA